MPSILVGPAFKAPELLHHNEAKTTTSVTQEIQAFRNALQQTKQWFQTMAESVDPDQLAFHDAILFYLTILEDKELLSSIERRIEKRSESAEEAIHKVLDDTRKKLKTGDAYFRNRVFDLDDVEQQLIRQFRLGEWTPSMPQLPEKPFVLFVRDLSISSLCNISFDRLLAVVAENGGYNSHAAIILNANQVPFLFVPDTYRHVMDEEEVLIDLTLGTVVFKPTTRQIAKSKTAGKNPSSSKAPAIHSPLILDETHRVSVYPAVNHLREADDPIVAQSEGIGLYRSEFMLFERNAFPTEEEQYQQYLALSKAAGGKIVHIRLFDIEPDKTLEMLRAKSFGAAFLLQNDDILITQLRALLRLSMLHPVGITVPMVQSVSELEQIRAKLAQTRAELQIEFPDASFPAKFGMMIETLAMTHLISKIPAVDYLQIGSNDLLSSLLEVSRDSMDFSPELFFDPLFLRMLKRISTEAKRKALPVYLCGEAANQGELLPFLVAMDISIFVPGPTSVWRAYGTLTAKRVEQAAGILPAVLTCETLSQVQKKMRFL